MPLSSARQLNNALFRAGRRYYVDRTSGLLTLIPPSGGTLSASDEVFVSVNDTIVNLVNKKDVTLKDLTSKAPSSMTMRRAIAPSLCHLVLVQANTTARPLLCPLSLSTANTDRCYERVC